MVLESTIVCVDNSDFMRNGDFLPSRLHAQQDAVNLVCHSKIRSNSENNVGLISLSNNTEVLVTLTNDVSKLLAKLHQLKPIGNINFLSGIKIAHLVLKHRQGKNHKMRIVAFVGSPIEDSEKELIKLGKRLRKEKVTVDIINFGEDAVNTEKLTTFISAINGTDATQNSHLVTVPPGPQLSEALISSPVMVGEDGVSPMNGGYMFGVDPNEDPELALALRVSMEEQRAHQEEEARRAANNATRTPVDKIEEETSEEMMLKQALELSMQGQTSDAKEPMSMSIGRDISTMTEEEQMAFALQMSMEVDQANPAPVEDVKMDDEDEKDPIKDPEFLRSILEGLPGVDPQSDAVNNAVDQFASNKDQEKKEGKKKDSKE